MFNVSRATSELAFWIKSLFYLPYFWYVEGMQVFTRTFVRLVIHLDQATAFTLMFRYFFVPLFGDYTLFGRILAIPFRIGRIILGAFVLVVVPLFISIVFLFWLVFPIIIFFIYPQLALVIIAILWVIAFYSRLGRPHKLVAGEWQEGFSLIDFAEDSARSVIRSSRTPVDLFDKLSKSADGKNFLARMGGTLDVDQAKLSALSLPDLYRASYELGLQYKCRTVRVMHLLAVIFQALDYRKEDALGTFVWLHRLRDWTQVPFIWEEEYQTRAIGGVNRAWTGRITPTLNNFSTDLTLEAAKGHLKLAIGKEKTIEKVSRILARARKANVLLVGPPGSGKTTLIEGIAQEVVHGTKFLSLQGRRVVALDPGALIAGAETEGALGERLQNIIEEIETSQGIILFIDEIHNLIVSGAQAQLAYVFNALRPHLESGKFQLIGATSWENYRRYLAPNEAFSQVFELVELPAATPEESIEVLEYQTLDLERNNRKVRITFPAINAAVSMSDRLIYERVLPDKAMDLLEEAVLAKQNIGGGIIGEEEIAQIVGEKTNVPVTAITQKEATALLNLEDKIHKGLIDQDEAVKAVSDALRRARVGLGKGKKPIATFLFVGPTGVGKTELSKVLAEEYFGSGPTKASFAVGGASFGSTPMIRIDMSEFADLKNIYRLVGSPPAADVSEPGQLTEAVRQRPFSLVLLDEFEKAHPQVLNLFLQVFDDGRLTDGKGETVDFTHTIIIATSNAGTKYIQDQLAAGRTVEGFKNDFLEQLRGIFAPELLNRFDGVMIFKPLTEEDLAKIVALKVAGLEKELTEKNIKLVATPDFVAKIAQLGYAPEWGARPLTRVMQDQVEGPLARKLLSGEIKEGQTVTLDLKFLAGYNI